MDDTRAFVAVQLEKTLRNHAEIWLHARVQQPPQSRETALLTPDMSATRKQPGATSRRRLRVLYSGHVQGIGFRYTARTVAAGFEVAGTVRNLPDGRVELVAEGTKSELEAFCAAIRDSGLAGFIRNEDAAWSDAQGRFRGFEIVR